MTKVTSAISVVMLMLAAVPSSNLFAAVPSEVEWSGWPEYCRVRFAVAGDGVGSKYEMRISKSEISHWEQRMGQAWRGLPLLLWSAIHAARKIRL